MDILFSISFFVFGAILGSFINVVSLRYNTGLNLSGRSKCFSCSKTLHFFELIPIFSFIFLRGKCSKCKSKIFIQYPIVEFTMAILSFLLFIKFGLSLETFYFIFIFCLLLIITIYDFRHKIIPEGVVYLFILFSFLFIFFDMNELIFRIPNIYNIISGPIVAFPLFFLWFISGGKWIGLGDSKLLLGIGFLLGVFGGLSALALAFWVGAIFSLGLIFLNKILNEKELSLNGKRITMKSEVPFAPFIIIGFMIVFFTGINLFPM
ncbi:prepilin peptidase [Patescibacteria group bacterium]|nr:prepilin peptidase [Patescibacteria group bacterium]MBU4115704.1 prepilin peptidase [Patescibacteria group bacterium]